MDLWLTLIWDELVSDPQLNYICRDLMVSKKSHAQALCEHAFFLLEGGCHSSLHHHHQQHRHHHHNKWYLNKMFSFSEFILP